MEPRKKSFKRKTYSPTMNASDLPPKQLILAEENPEVAALAAKLDGEEIDLQAGMKLLIHLQTSSNETVNKILANQENIFRWLENLEEAVIEVENRISVLEESKNLNVTDCADIKRIQMENQELKQRIVELEDRSRRNNIVISGVPETAKETWDDTEAVVVELFKSKMNLEKIVIERAHRVGKKKADGTRPIVCKLLNFKDKERIRKNSFKLKDSGVYINEDFSVNTRNARYYLRQFSKSMKSKGAQTVRMSYDKLFIDNKMYKFDNEINSVIEIPQSEQTSL